MLARCGLRSPPNVRRGTLEAVETGDRHALARLITAVDRAQPMRRLRSRSGPGSWPMRPTRRPVVGVTGTGGAGKSSLTDELPAPVPARRTRPLHIAVVSVDPTGSKTGGALLGDRIRMNALDARPRVHAFARHPVAHGRELTAAMRDASPLQGRPLRPDPARDERHRSGRRGDRAVRERRCMVAAWARPAEPDSARSAAWASARRLAIRHRRANRAVDEGLMPWRCGGRHRLQRQRRDRAVPGSRGAAPGERAQACARPAGEGRVEGFRQTPPGPSSCPRSAPAISPT